MPRCAFKVARPKASSATFNTPFASQKLRQIARLESALLYQQPARKSTRIAAFSRHVIQFLLIVETGADDSCAARALLSLPEHPMKRAQDKIKDFVEPQHFDEVQKYADDPTRALAAYHFTDATSDLVARWLDALANCPRGRGAARALAGQRGVGKSHLLAAFGALAALPELRSTVSDAHVATSARRLLNRRYVVARVERGTRPTLLEEMAFALATALGSDQSQFPPDASAMLAMAAGQIGDATLVLIIDTAFGREARVARDDGSLLSQLAAATEHVGAFIALALDDDIEGADGANVSLAGSFQIDYLDPEHLYRVADLHLFRKNIEARHALHEVYSTLRADVPGFNWSEPRFAAIYPVHPLVAELASSVRLYAPTFAFLPFAASAVARAINRPATSLVVLDEVFDRADYDLRKADELQDVFKAYDFLAAQTVAEFPIMQRLQAKLVLKGLFVLSLDGRGATARELGAAMLIYDEAAPEAAVGRIEAMLARFAETAPQGALRKSLEADGARYRFIIDASAGFDAALAEASARIASENPAATTEQLRGIARTRFEDWPFAEPAPSPTSSAQVENVADGDAAELAIVWRGTSRRVRLVWHSSNDHAPLAARASAESDAPSSDFDIIVLAPNVNNFVASDDAQPLTLWRPALPSAEELDALHRLVALRTNAALISEFGDAARAAERAHTALAERLWTRLYMDDGALVAGETTLHWTDAARAAPTLSEALAKMLAPLFGVRYSEHPVFTDTLTEAEVSRLVGGLFGGANQTDAGVQELARNFAAPLGLVSVRGGTYGLEAGDQALDKAWARDVLQMTDEAGGGVVALEEIDRKLRREPYGLGLEAQHLVLAALVAGRRIELITQTNDRVGRRTLDHALKWDEIKGVARAAAVLHSADELTAWARLLTQNPALVSITDSAAREDVRAALIDWLDRWRSDELLQRFENLPDEGLTTRAWKLAEMVRKSFGVAAESIEAALADTLSLEECLQRVADAFGDAHETFARLSQQLAELSNFIGGLAARESARVYLAAAEPSGANEVESLRGELLRAASDTQEFFDHEANKQFEQLWNDFHARYTEQYEAAHERVVGASFDRRAIDLVLRGDEWREFELLSQLSVVNKTFWNEASRLLEQAADVRCELPVRHILREQPVCECSFRLSRAADTERLADSLAHVTERGLKAHRRTLARWSAHLAHALQSLAQESSDVNAQTRALALGAAFAEKELPALRNAYDVELLEGVLQKTGVPPLRIALPQDGYGLLTRDELSVRLQQWLDDLPDYPALVEVVGENNNGSDSSNGNDGS